MDIIATIESAAHTSVEAVEHPFHTIGDRLKAIGESLATFFGHPYCAPPLKDALTELHGVVSDLAQEVAELRVPCPCKPAPTSATVAAPAAVVEEPAAPEVAHVDETEIATGHESANAEQAVVSAADLAEFQEWKAQRAALQNAGA